MNVYILRHASAGKGKPNSAQDDKRPLDKEGIEQCGNVGRLLAALNVQVDAVISSPLKRAVQTASLVANELGHERQIVFSEALGPNATLGGFREMLAKYAQQEDILVVGHNPSLSQFLSSMITGGANENAIDLKKGAVALVDYDSRTGTELIWSITPKIARAVYELTAARSRPKTSRK